jgi:hypothetical protein
MIYRRNVHEYTLAKYISCFSHYTLLVVVLVSFKRNRPGWLSCSLALYENNGGGSCNADVENILLQLSDPVNIGAGSYYPIKHNVI